MTTIEVRGHSLAENEQIIGKGLATFIEVGNALMDIRDGRQYIEAGYDSFEEYCRNKWGMDRHWPDQQIATAQVAAIAATAGPVPRSEWVARPLTKVLNQDGEDAVRQAWGQIVEAHEGDVPITGKEVRRFLSLGGGSYHPPGWFEMLGEVAMTLERAAKQLARLEEAISRKPNVAFRERAEEYAELAADIETRLGRIGIRENS